MSINQYLSKRGLVVLAVCTAAFIILIAHVGNILKDYTRKLDSCMININRNSSLQQRPKSKEASRLNFNSSNMDRFNSSDKDRSKSFITIYNMEQENKGNFKCVSMRIVPPTKVCVHDVPKDRHVSGAIVRHGVWEGPMLKEVKAELMKDNQLGLLDIGANIGVYTLYAATLGRKVVAVEPYEKNILRLHKAAVLGGVTKNIVLLQNAVSDTRDSGVLRLSRDNQGDTRVLMTHTPCTIKPCAPTIKTILLSDLRYLAPFKKAIMKIDIQGYEHLAFKTCEPLMDVISIPTIFMEWELLLRMRGSDYETVKAMMDVLYKRGYLPYRLQSEGGGAMLKRSLHRMSWPVNVVWRRNTTAKNP